MSFWAVQLGPHYDGDARGDGDHRCIGEIVCPDCNNVMARLLEKPGGVGLHAWVPATGQAPGNPDSRRVGWSLFAHIDETTLPDDEGSVLNCWRGHGGLWITAGDCRAVIRRYREKARKVRHPAGRMPSEPR